MDTMNFLNEVSARFPDAISFAAGRPYDGFFDTGRIVDDTRRYLDHLGESGRSPRSVRDALFQYGGTAGQIQPIIAEWLRLDEGIDVAAESIVVTVGAQEVMMLAVRALIADPGEVLLVSGPCYVGITGIARLLDIAPAAVPEDQEGFDCAGRDRRACRRAIRSRCQCSTVSGRTSSRRWFSTVRGNGCSNAASQARSAGVNRTRSPGTCRCRTMT